MVCGNWFESRGPTSNHHLSYFLPVAAPFDPELPIIDAVILVRIYKDDKPKWTRVELEQWFEYLWYGTERYCSKDFFTQFSIHKTEDS